MRKLHFLTLGMALLMCVSACKKDDEDDGETTVACTNNKNFCVKVGSEKINDDATFRIITVSQKRYRVSWEEGNGTTYRNIELDIYSDDLTPGTYNLVENPATGQGQLQYYADQKGYISTSGSVTISAISTDKISGTFSGTIEYQGDTKSVTDGNFVNVPL